ncbi:hypothetical protein MKX01_022902, partial [Papaver californicum]
NLDISEFVVAVFTRIDLVDSADVFLWRNKKISASILGGATVAWVLFELLEYHLLTLVYQCAILTLAVLFLYSNASTFIQKSRPKIPEVHLPEDPFLQIAAGMRIEINRDLACLCKIASRYDLKKFLAVSSIIGFTFL